MEVKSLGLIPTIAALDQDREQRVTEIRKDRGFQRATPPQAEAPLTEDQLKQGLAHFAGQVLMGQFKRPKSSLDEKRKKTLAYQQSSQFECGETPKGSFLNKKI